MELRPLLKSFAPEVRLLAITSHAEELIEAAAHGCASSETSAALLDAVVPTATHYRRRAEFLRDLYVKGHRSVFEHASISFSISGVSRVLSHQLVRHRHASFSQQSQRYVTMDADMDDSTSCIIEPMTFAKMPEDLRDEVNEGVSKVYELYKKLIRYGIPREDARYLLPHGWATSLTTSMNLREFMHVCQQRLCKFAQWEIRYVTAMMLAIIRPHAPIIAELIDDQCHTDCFIFREGKCQGKQIIVFEDQVRGCE